MWLAIQSVYDGTWGGSTVPQEIVDFEMMHTMHWSWRDLQETPAYVRRFVWDCIQARREAEDEANRRGQRSSEGVQRIRR